ncbi:FecR family protein [Tunicatimonas pelagia]|uniref:FecR family protein n=1 Tax=Tunicatimonas pelagia TaxID=931531 RepID=UPI002666B74B|nr:FecR domain-containing protein [Tunicatimonas pelagia]WKN44954.1 FecR domain-containing protein [Tunicatimonas pelagia]
MDDKHSLTSLMMDDRFRAWVTNPTPELDRYWEQYLFQHPEAKPVIEQARAVLQHMNFPKSSSIDREGILKRALAQANAEPSSTQLSAPSSSQKVHRLKSWYWAAASVIGILLISIYWFIALGTHSYQTAYGESERIVLPDSSVVILNANSELRYSRSWDQDSPRQVELIGEAFFSVTHQVNQQKFIVQANDLAIEVLGTEFNVNNRRGKTAVMLQRGSVRLNWSVGEANRKATSDTTATATIEPGELAVYSQDRNELTRQMVNPRVYSSWTDSQWVFDKTSLSEIFTMIEDTYGYRVVLEQPAIADRVFTAELTEANLELLLDFLSESFNLIITKDEHTITIQKKTTTQQ